MEDTHSIHQDDLRLESSAAVIFPILSHQRQALIFLWQFLRIFHYIVRSLVPFGRPRLDRKAIVAADAPGGYQRRCRTNFLSSL